MSAEFIPNATQLIDQVEAASPLSWLSDHRQQSKAAFANMSFPTKKTEAWKYSSLYALGQLTIANDLPEAANADLGGRAIEQLKTDRLVFVNGQFSESLSQYGNAAGVSVVRFSEADENQQVLIRKNLSSADNKFMGSLANALVHEGVFVHLAKNALASQPIEVIHMTTEAASDHIVPSRLLVLLETGAQATVIEQFTGYGENAVMNNATDLVVGDNALLTHYRLQQEDEQVMHFGAINCQLGRDANLNSFHLGLGGKIKRIDIDVHHNVGGSHCELRGVYLPQNKQHIDYHTNVEHKVPHCTTNEIFRGIIADEAKAVFNGRIHILQDAQKTLAEMSNRNLLLSNKAEIDTKPELEIYADDVKCAHGATISRLDDLGLFYLMSRGIDKQEAEVMLSFGFINELLDDLAHEELRNHIRPVIAKWFGKSDELTRHLAL